MKTKIFAFLLSAFLFGCQKDKNEAIYVPNVLTSNQDFNFYPKENDKTLTINTDNGENSTAAPETEGQFSVKFGDTTVRIQTNRSDKNAVVDKFAFAQFVNTQKTCMLVQIADSSGLVAPFYLIAIKNGSPEVTSLYRPSKGAQDRRFTKGLSRVGSSGFLINNDFFVTNVNAQVYLIKRQLPEERIQGDFFIKSPDKYTLVFLVSSSLYEVHYPTNETFTQTLGTKVPKEPKALIDWIQNNYSWQKNKKGIAFLKTNSSDKIIDISEFK